jgi:hypothetical protein
VSAVQRRGVAALLTILATVTVFGCGSDGPSAAELAAQDRVVMATQRKQNAHARIVAAVRAKNRLLRAQKRAAALRAKRARKRYRVIIRDVPVPVAVSVAPDICGPIRGGGPQSQRERKRLRRQALYYLNLHC